MQCKRAIAGARLPGRSGISLAAVIGDELLEMMTTAKLTVAGE
jgi:hypothetical protein